VSREAVLNRVRTALGRKAGQLPPVAPLPLLMHKRMDTEQRVTSFINRFEALAGKAVRVPDIAAAQHWLQVFLTGRTVVASNAAIVNECLAGIPQVLTGFRDGDALKAACSEANVGVTSADYAFAETGTMVMISGPDQPRLISLLPPVHIAIFRSGQILVGLDELFTLLPRPAEQTSSMVMITGPSRTADIEQILVRGVHGPGEIYAVILEA
jgi:L-lactate dehydrogenase complex protein LldG